MMPASMFVIACAALIFLAWVAWEALMLLARWQRCKDVVSEHEKRESVIDSVERRV